MLSTIQDEGRPGYAEFGIPSGGAMDKMSYRLANVLVGNDINTPAIEITLLGPKILVESEGLIALTGADLSAKIDDKKLNLNCTYKVPTGSIITFGKCMSGCRAYLAVRGNWYVNKWLGSVSPLNYAIKGWEQESILKSDSTIFIEDDESNHSNYAVSLNLKDTVKQHTGISVQKGPEYDWFDEKTIQTFINSQYIISPESNRMGYRLKGPLIDPINTINMISSAVIPGTIQITSGGHPIILMADAQTTGGYPRIGYIDLAGQCQLAQKKPGDSINFELCE